MTSLRHAAFALLLGLFACGGETPDPVVKTVQLPALAVAPTALTLTVGTAPVGLSAALSGGTGAISWSLDGPGELSATTGATVTYTPPATADASTLATVTAAAADLTATVSITLNPLTTQWVVSPEDGSDDNPGTEAKPFKTLTHALSVASAGQKVLLEDAIYDLTSGEVWPATVPAGVVIEAVHPGGAVLSGAPSDLGLKLAGDASLKDLYFKAFGRALSSASTGTVGLSGVTVDGGGLSFSGLVKATLSAVTLQNLPANAIGIYVDQSASVTVMGGSISGNGYVAGCDGAEGLYIVGSAAASLTNVNITNLGGDAVMARDSSSVSIQGGVISHTGQTDCAGAQLTADGAATLRLEDATVTDGNDDGFLVYTSANSVHLTRVTVGAHPGYGMSLQGGHATIEDSQFLGSNTALSVGTGAWASVSGSTFTENNTGISVGVQAQLSLSGSQISGGNIAISDSGSVNLGTASSPGGNTLKAATRVLSMGSTASDVSAVGNTWEANQQGADAQGHYATQTITGAVSGRNFSIPAGKSVSL